MNKGIKIYNAFLIIACCLLTFSFAVGAQFEFLANSETNFYRSDALQKL